MAGPPTTASKSFDRYADRLAYWVSEPDRGQSHGINKGLERSSGAIIGWLNSDDTLMPDAVVRVVEAMQDTPMVVHGSVRLIDAESNIIARPKLSKAQPGVQSPDYRRRRPGEPAGRVLESSRLWSAPGI